MELKHFYLNMVLIQGFLADAIETVTNNEIKKFLLKKIEKSLNEYR